MILDLNPEKYEKPKDYLFFDFFSIYAKNSIAHKRGGKAAPISGGRVSKT